jgi:hypothetical protein
MVRFEKLCPELIMRENNLAHYIHILEYLKEQGEAIEEHFKQTNADIYIDFGMLLHNYKSASSYLITRFIGECK